jgi:transcriptional regulator with XRE-family HTH domain
LNRKLSAEICNRLAYNLIRLRAARGLTQRRLGAVSGLCKTYISDVEQGNVNISLGQSRSLGPWAWIARSSICWGALQRKLPPDRLNELSHP